MMGSSLDTRGSGEHECDFENPRCSQQYIGRRRLLPRLGFPKCVGQVIIERNELDNDYPE